MITKSIELNEQEAKAVVELLNVAIKAVGISDGGTLATNASYLANKIYQPFVPVPEAEGKKEEVKKEVPKKKK